MTPTYDALYAFLKAHYKHERFEGRKPPEWAPGYSNTVAHSCMERLKQNGFTNISQYESATGNAIWFDASLTILTDEEDIRERLRRTRSLPSLPEHGLRQSPGSIPVVP